MSNDKTTITKKRIIILLMILLGLVFMVTILKYHLDIVKEGESKCELDCIDFYNGTFIEFSGDGFLGYSCFCKINGLPVELP